MSPESGLIHVDLPMEFGRYTLLSKLDGGGMAGVFLARQAGPEGFEKKVVIKMIHPQLAGKTDFVDMFFNEARLAALLSHANVVAVYDFGQHPDLGYFLAMEYLEGTNLLRFRKAHITKYGYPPSFALCAQLLIAACEGLHYVHSLKAQDTPLNLVHCDVSPENIFITTEGTVKLLDFGVAKAAALADPNDDGRVKGKFAYMAPEQLRGEPVDRRVDIWALGATMYWLLGGKRPFRGNDDTELISRVLNADPEPLTNVPAPLADIVRKMLQKSAEQRYQRIDEVQHDLLTWSSTVSATVSRIDLAALVKELQAFAVPRQSGGTIELLKREESSVVESDVLELSSVATAATNPPPRPARWRLIGAAWVDWVPALLLLRFTYQAAPWAPFAVLAAVTLISVYLNRATLGQRLFGLMMMHRGMPISTLRAAARLLIGGAWFIALSGFIAALYASSPLTVFFEWATVITVLAMLIGAAGWFTARKQNLFDRLLSVLVVKRGE